MERMKTSLTYQGVWAIVAALVHYLVEIRLSNLGCNYKIYELVERMVGIFN